MAQFDREQLRDKILGCWAGKNIGGTVGGPFEGQAGPLDVEFYTHKMDGQPLPNDDLDLQWIWLSALEIVGVDELTVCGGGIPDGAVAEMVRGLV